MPTSSTALGRAGEDVLSGTEFSAFLLLSARSTGLVHLPFPPGDLAICSSVFSALFNKQPTFRLKRKGHRCCWGTVKIWDLIRRRGPACHLISFTVTVTTKHDSVVVGLIPLLK